MNGILVIGQLMLIGMIKTSSKELQTNHHVLLKKSPHVFKKRRHVLLKTPGRFQKTLRRIARLLS